MHWPILLLLFPLYISLGVSVLAPKGPPRPRLPKDPKCTNFTLERRTFTFNTLGTGSSELSHGAGRAFREQNTLPLVIPSNEGWAVIDCADEQAKVSNIAESCVFWEGSARQKALFSPGSVQAQHSAPSLGIPHPSLRNSYITFTLLSLYVTPLIPILPIGEPVQVTISAIHWDGSDFTLSIEVKNGEKNLLDFENMVDVILGWDDFNGVRISVWKNEEPERLFPFVVDQLVVREKVLGDDCKKIKPAGRAVTGERGPCKPKDVVLKNMKRWTVNFEGFPSNNILPQYYAGLNWASDAIYVRNITELSVSSTEGKTQGPIKAPSGVRYISHNPFTVVADRREDRFGVKGLWIACRFDDGVGKGDICRITFLGQRDPYEGSVLPIEARATVEIRHPGRQLYDPTATRTFTYINLDKFKFPGGFHDLYRFDIFSSSNHVLLYDDIEFTREESSAGHKAELCRAPGEKSVDFLRISSITPDAYSGSNFKFPRSEWKLSTIPSTRRSAIQSTARPSSYSSYKFQPENLTYPYFDLTSLTIHTNIPATNTSALNALRLTLIVHDSCGAADRFFHMQSFHRSEISFQGKPSIVLDGRVVRAITKVELRVFFAAGSGFSTQENVEFWVSGIGYRNSREATRGCDRCGYRGLEWCENPKVRRFTWN